MKKEMVLIVALSLIVMWGYGCDGGVVTEDPGNVSGTSETELYYPRVILLPTGATTISAGYAQSLDNVQWLSRKLASEGFVVLAFTPANTLGMITGWRDGHRNCIAKLVDLNESHSVLKGKIDTAKLQTAGYAEGGGGALWAASLLAGDLKTAVGMVPCPGDAFDSTLGAIKAATFIQAGELDAQVPNDITRGEFASLGNIPRMYTEYCGYDHMAWDGATGTTADRISGDTIVWMRYYMDGDSDYSNTLYNAEGTALHEWYWPMGTSSSSSSSSSTSTSGGDCSGTSSSGGNSSSGGCN